jgi:hypothetical protein
VRASALVIVLLGGVVVAGPAHAAAAGFRDFKAVQGKDGHVAVTGRVVKDGKGVAGAHLGLTYVPKGHSGDSLWVPLTASSSGRFALRHLLPHDGTWKIAYGSVSKKITSNTRYVSGIGAVKAVRKGGSVTLGGKLRQYVGSPIENGSWKTLTGKVTVSYRSSAKGAWVRKGSFTAKGTFKRTFTGGGGTWRLRYAGGPEQRPVTVDIRGTSK